MKMTVSAAALMVLMSAAAPLHAQDTQDPAVVAGIDEAFRLAGVRAMLEALPAHIQEMTTVAVAQFPREQRRQFEPAIKEVNLQFRAPEASYQQLQAYFVKHYDTARMNTFLALQKTPVYRTMHRLDESADTPTAQAARRRFEANLKSDPPEPKRVNLMQRLDDARNTTVLQMRIVVVLVNAMTTGLGAQLPGNLETQNTEFAAKIRPILADNVLHTYLYAYRNTDDADLEDYVAAAQQKDVDWFNRNLEAAMLAVVTDRAMKAGDSIKAKMSQPVK